MNLMSKYCLDANVLIVPDPWVIAHAMAQQACVVTKEKKQTAKTDRIRIPNVCEKMAVR